MGQTRVGGGGERRMGVVSLAGVEGERQPMRGW